MQRSVVLQMVRTQKKARTSTVFKSVTAADIERAETRGADVRRVWELQNVVTKQYPDLLGMPSSQVLKEIRSHRNRHQKVSLSWLHLYLSKVQTKEEAETIAPQAVMEYQASGFQLTPDTAGHLVNVTVRTKSDLAFMVLCNPTKYRIWPTHNVFGRLMRHYGALGDVDAVKVLWRVARDKGLQPDKLYYQFYIRAFTRSPELKDTKRALWDMAMPALRAGQIDIVGTNLMLKVCLRDPAAPRDELLAQVAKMQGNGATAKLVEEIKSTPPPTEVLPPAVEVSAAGAAAAAASMAGGARNAAQARH